MPFVYICFRLILVLHLFLCLFSDHLTTFFPPSSTRPFLPHTTYGVCVPPVCPPACPSFRLSTRLCTICVPLAGSRPDPLGRIRPRDDGCDCGYDAAAGRGRRRFSVGHFPDRSLGQLLHRRLHASARVQVHYPRPALPAVHPVYVLAPHHLFPHQPEQRLVGNP